MTKGKGEGKGRNIATQRYLPPDTGERAPP